MSSPDLQGEVLLSFLDLSPPQPQGRDTQGGAREEEGQEEETGHVDEGQDEDAGNVEEIQQEDAGHVQEVQEEGGSWHMTWPL